MWARGGAISLLFLVYETPLTSVRLGDAEYLNKKRKFSRSSTIQGNQFPLRPGAQPCRLLKPNILDTWHHHSLLN